MPETLLHPSIFVPPVMAGFTTRHFSRAEESLDAVRKRVSALVGMPVASVGQVHRDDVVLVREPGHTPEHDGLVTDQPGVLLTVMAADCALVLLSDVEAGVVGACHSGWRGTVAGITGETIRAMETLGARPANIRAYVAPCISAEAFEVGEEVAAQFDGAVVQRRADWPRPHVDLRAELVRQLEAAGVEQMEVSEGCTIRDNAQFYSYRAEDGTRGRMIGFIGLAG